MLEIDLVTFDGLEFFTHCTFTFLRFSLFVSLDGSCLELNGGMLVPFCNLILGVGFVLRCTVIYVCKGGGY